MDFTNKRVLVTGSSRGIGFDIAKMFLDAGARVAIHGSTEQSAGTAMERLGHYEHKVAAPGDIGTVAGCESAVEMAIEAFGGLDILVNNAGVGAGRPIADCDEATSTERRVATSNATRPAANSRACRATSSLAGWWVISWRPKTEWTWRLCCARQRTPPRARYYVAGQ